MTLFQVLRRYARLSPCIELQEDAFLASIMMDGERLTRRYRFQRGALAAFTEDEAAYDLEVAILDCLLETEAKKAAPIAVSHPLYKLMPSARLSADGSRAYAHPRAWADFQCALIQSDPEFTGLPRTSGDRLGGPLHQLNSYKGCYADTGIFVTAVLPDPRAE